MQCMVQLDTVGEPSPTSDSLHAQIGQIRIINLCFYCPFSLSMSGDILLHLVMNTGLFAQCLQR